MDTTDRVLSIGFLNTRGQTGLTDSKQSQIEAFICREKLDILNLQEIHISEESFSACNNICSLYNVVSNNSISKYGTASIISSDYQAENIVLDSNGRAIFFDIGPLTVGNIYLPSGNDAAAKSGRENYFSETLPQLLLNRKECGIIGGDINCILAKIDCTHHPGSKISQGLGRFIQTFDMKDSFRSLFPTSKVYSHYYHTVQLGQGATRIDTSFNWGQLRIVDARYVPVAFSDHMAYIVKIVLPDPSSRMISPKTRPLYKISPEVICDEVFKERLKDSMVDWQEVKAIGLEVLEWWEWIVKPGIKKLALQRSKELNREKQGELSMLLIKQAYLGKKLLLGEFEKYAELRSVQVAIEEWYQKESSKILIQSRSQEVNRSEKVRIFHHNLHKKHVKRSSILKLQSELGLLVGHEECAGYLEQQVGDLLLHPHIHDHAASECLLGEVDEVFTEEDNQVFLSPPSQSEVKEVLASSNLFAAPGTDGIPSLLYSRCWETMGNPLTEVVQEIHKGSPPTKSMRTSLMVFGTKPKKPTSLKPGDKRRISLLNSDFKIVTGIEAKRFGNTATHSLSPIQLVAGSDRRIHHGINLARDAINQAGKIKTGCGILDLDFMAGFDWLDMNWVYRVLSKKGVCQAVINRIKLLYADNNTVVVVNNLLGRNIPNIRGSLRQGDRPSMFWFAVGIDPLLVFLERRLKGIPLISLPVLGPVTETASQAVSPCLPPLEQSYKIVAYADDVKPSITSMQEFYLVDQACSMLEKASGVKLHRDPSTEKIRFLALGRWRGVLAQEDLPHQYIKISDHLDFIGVELRATFTQTRKVNGDQLQLRIKNIIGPWKAGRFMSLTLRPYSVNTFAFSKVWFKCNSVNLRSQDINAINSQAKSWLYQDCLEKPNELVLHRDVADGGLGLFHVQTRSLAILIRSFLETSANPLFRHSLFHELLYRYHVLGDSTAPNPGLTPYYDQNFFNTIKHYRDTSPLNIEILSTKQWYRLLLEDRVLMHQENEDSPPTLRPIRAEILQPHSDWPFIWKILRIKGLASDLTGFLFRLLHHLLPTQDRVHRILGDVQGQQGLCLLCHVESDDLSHAFFTCQRTSVAGHALLGYLQSSIPHLTTEEVLRLELGQGLDDVDLLAAVCLLSVGLKYIWDTRVEKKTVHLYKMRAEIEARISILRRTRYMESGNKMLEMIN